MREKVKLAGARRDLLHRRCLLPLRYVVLPIRILRFEGPVGLVSVVQAVAVERLRVAGLGKRGRPNRLEGSSLVQRGFAGGRLWLTIMQDGSCASQSRTSSRP